MLFNHWLEANQQYLTIALTEVRQRLEYWVKQTESTTPVPAVTSLNSQQMAATMPTPPALETLCQIFGLSSFERFVLLLCAGIELDGTFPQLCAAIQGGRTYVTFGLALAVFSESDWSVLYPGSPLRHWRLIEVSKSEGLTRSPIQIDERVLHYLTGGQDLDDRLASIVEFVPPTGELVASHQAIAERMAVTWTQETTASVLPVIQLYGLDSSSQRAIAARACASLGLSLYAMSILAIPSNSQDLEDLIRLWEREAALSNSALLLDCHSLNAAETNRNDGSDAYGGLRLRLIEKLRGGIILSSRERRHPQGRSLITLDVYPPTTEEQKYLWQNALGVADTNLNATVATLVSQFNLNTSSIRSICTAALGQIAAQKKNTTPETPPLPTLLWDICRSQSRPHLADLAQPIEPVANWEELVLPDQQKQLLQEISVHVRQRMTVYETWGFASTGSRGLGISALFAGLSGTGKTMAAEVLAKELRLDLYRIDLSSVVSKYIGETEKNLRRVFDAAEQGGAILLFDEADALFGKRSEVKDSHDRYANIEVSYLLQRMEAYRGLAILTTNLKNALDPAFMRRIRFIIQFPFPDITQRQEIWQRIFPSATPTENLDVNKLARLNVSGGNIRNIALYAAFLAAEAQEPVQMKHLLRAARVESAKSEKSLTDAEIRGWI